MSGDACEQAAEQAADHVMRTHDTSQVRQSLQTISPAGLEQAAAPPIVHEVLHSSGEPLDRTARAFMEQRFAQDFGDVRIHADSRASSSAQSIHANAYTHGHHIVFNSGQYAPDSSRGKHLLAHELAHVVQQRSQHSPGIARQPAPKPEPEKKPGSTPSPKDQASAGQSHQQDLCSKINLSALRLPRKNNSGAQFFEITVGDIRFLAAVSDKQAAIVNKNVKAVAARIDKLNQLVTDPARKLKLVIVVGGSSEFRLLCGQPALLIDPDEFTGETGTHEAMHGVTDSLIQQSKKSDTQSAAAKNFLNKAADIYLQLKDLTIQIGPGQSVAATDIVDPQTLNPKESPEHPGDNVDEFLSSAVAGYLTYKAKLKETIDKFGKKDPKVAKAGQELLRLLGDALDKGALPANPVPVASSTPDIEAQIAKIKPTKEIDDSVLITHNLLNELFLLN
jgi:hypothetical protein